MKKTILVILAAVLLVTSAGCLKSDASENNTIDNAHYMNKKENTEIDIERFSLENEIGYDSGYIYLNYYLDENNNLWSWKTKEVHEYLKTFQDSSTKPEIVLNDVKSIVKYDAKFDVEPHFIKNDNSLWVIEDEDNNSVTYTKILDNVKYSTYGYAITENGDLYDILYRKNSLPYLSEKTGKLLENVESIDVSGPPAFAIDKDGNLWSWGDYCGSELGQGSDYIESAKPQIILDNVKTIVRSYDRGDPTIYAIKTDNTLWAWGNNKYGAVGNGTTEGVNVPVKIMDDVKDVTAAAVGDGSFETYSFAYALKNDGTLWSWGYNGEGEAGNGTTESVLAPVKILDDVAEIQKDNSLEKNISYALKEDGSLWGWGLNYYGQLGNGTTEYVLEPIKIMDNVKSYDSYYEALYVIKEDDTLWGSGLNISYFMGEKESTLKFTKLMDNAESTELMRNAVLAIGKDGSLSICGYNDITFIDGERRAVSYIDKNKILDDVKWIESEVSFLYVMTDGGNLYRLLIDEDDGKVLFTEPYKMEYCE